MSIIAAALGFGLVVLPADVRAGRPGPRWDEPACGDAAEVGAVTALEWRRPEVRSRGPRRAAGGWETTLRVPVKAQRLVELQRAADGQDVPCMTTDRQLWVSENRQERRSAARLCAGCPVFAQCGAAAEAEPVEVWGVWAGREYFELAAQRPRNRALPELDAARLRRLMEASRDSRERGELGRDLVQLRRSGFGTTALARTAGVSLPTVAYAATRGYRMTQTRARQPALPDGDPDATRLAELRDLAAPWGPGRRGIDPDLLAERNVLLLRLRSRNPGVWSWRRLGELAGLSASVVGRVLGRGLVVSAPGPRRVAVIAAEVEARATDPRVRRLADLRAVLAGAPPRTHPVERAERARLVVDLWRGDPRIWSGRHLAIAAGTSPGWVTGVVKAALQASAGEGGVM